MTVEQLIKELQKYDPHTPVSMLNVQNGVPMDILDDKYSTGTDEYTSEEYGNSPNTVYIHGK